MIHHKPPQPLYDVRDYTNEAHEAEQQNAMMYADTGLCEILFDRFPSFHGASDNEYEGGQ